ncbi:Dph6-related ATP pyrophosphatase [Paraclostridium sordellii]|uniref:ATP-binding protein n=1 Tax=Paraclostridium sordellii TaxID=1505 RepID=A0A0C7QA89_PARSO|nr:diphthine--ammonia ligase [Paeniclostridium sordellii]QYE99236.1 diphthine--ammonia ligase [Paeniclostridium sordellii]CEN78035.1 ATP-binding protein [[Clostridium] sordellii] [Paeniclostridium sordellii]CEO07286.1 ATP-binding protein [[Clostridium] sordellii] [Paeniclostridium sordellii]CEP86839.1 ATP-binding protein [[Clostridium] sordellii] [Paeniclostridium sordellii]CEP97717.1 ATP-binding protein [[Clostridium] sordellii] [Paeniclostridium sordellii]
MDNGFIMSFSGGKDSTLALYRMIKKGYKPVALLTTLKKNKGKSWTHGITNSLLEKVSNSLQIPILKVECDIDEYETEFEKALIEGKKMGAQICVFGDIDIEEHKQWDISRCENTGLKAKFPLWQEDRGKLVYEFIDSGFTTIIKTINLKYLDEKYLGKVLDRSVVKEIELSGADICGENGEYHTFVINGPLFNQPIEFENKGKVLENGYAHLDIL